MQKMTLDMKQGRRCMVSGKGMEYEWEKD